MRNIEEIFSENLAHYRKRTGFRTQDDLAEALGVAKRTIQNWEQGVNLPELALLKALGTILNVHPSLLFADPNTPIDPIRAWEVVGAALKGLPKRGA